jgi:hypothetical protein
MTHRRIARPSVRVGVRAATFACAVALSVAACSATGASPSPTPEPTAAVAPPIVATPGASSGSALASAATASAPAGRTTTAWGEIWDAIPAAFPLPSGSSQADLPDGPLSGAYSTPAAIADTATAIADGLRAGGYRTVNAGTPAEDGSVTIDAVGSAAGCRVQVTVLPLGGLTAIEVLYGSACPAP